MATRKIDGTILKKDIRELIFVGNTCTIFYQLDNDSNNLPVIDNLTVTLQALDITHIDKVIESLLENLNKDKND